MIVTDKQGIKPKGSNGFNLEVAVFSSTNRNDAVIGVSLFALAPRIVLKKKAQIGPAPGPIDLMALQGSRFERAAPGANPLLIEMNEGPCVLGIDTAFTVPQRLPF
jgi:hypothetical protein